MKKAFFLDRDGILNKLVMRDGVLGSPRTISEFEVNTDARKLVDFIKRRKYLIVVITNQPDIQRKKMDAIDLDRMHSILREEFLLDEIQVCPTGDDSDSRRKPNPAMPWIFVL